MTEPTTTPSGSEYRVVTVADLRHELQREHLIINAHIQTISNQITALDLRFGDFREVIERRFAEAKDNTDQQFTAVDQRFTEAKDNTDQQFTAVDQRFTDMQHHMDQRFNAVDQRFTEMQHHIDQQFTAVDQRFAEARANTDQRFTEMQHHIDQRFTAIDQRFTAIDQRFAAVDQHFAEAKANTDQRFDQMEKLFVQVGRRFDALDERLRFNKTLVVASISAVASAASVVVSLLR
ncbi:MAG: hypothetical protein NWQ79_00355 [Ilumatobacteraceae bacterium]|nr:hypothetical protein [Ilumatobacteraceae bacterium]